MKPYYNNLGETLVQKSWEGDISNIINMWKIL